jgi:ATP-dependent DNA ligase
MPRYWICSRWLETDWSRVYVRVSGDYARIVSIAKARVGFVEPMLAVAVTKLPEGPAWSYELQFDGYRVIGVKAARQVRSFSRNGKEFTRRFASIAPPASTPPTLHYRR